MTPTFDFEYWLNICSYFAALGIIVGIGLIFIAVGIFAVRWAWTWRRK